MKGLFDLNHDGKLSSFEKATGFAMTAGIIDSMMEEERQAELDDELFAAGLDRDDLDFMDEEERREALENAGLDPDDYDD